MTRPKPKTRPMLAYNVQEEDEGTGGIVFATSSIAARREGANRYHGGDFSGLMCRRAKWADSYAPGPVPQIAMVENGWAIKCAGCGRGIGEGYDNERRSLFVDKVEVDGGLYCEPACRARHVFRKAAYEMAEITELKRLRERLWAEAPGVTFTQHGGVTWNWSDGVCDEPSIAAAWIGFLIPSVSEVNCIGYGYWISEERDRPVPHGTYTTERFEKWKAEQKAKQQENSNA